jgi:hypothetical protein
MMITTLRRFSFTSLLALCMAPQSEARADGLGSILNEFAESVDALVEESVDRRVIYYDCKIEKGKVKECGGWSNGYYLLRSSIGKGMRDERYDYYPVENGKIASSPKPIGGAWKEGAPYVLKIDGLYQKCLFTKTNALKTCVGMFSGTAAVPK